LVSRPIISGDNSILYQVSRKKSRVFLSIDVLDFLRVRLSFEATRSIVTRLLDERNREIYKYITFFVLNKKRLPRAPKTWLRQAFLLQPGQHARSTRMGIGRLVSSDSTATQTKERISPFLSV
jgi:hypothetical protein